MKTQTIQQIEKLMNQAEQALNGFILEQHQEERYGSEQEYTPQSLKGDIRAILLDLRGLVKVPDKFVQLSTYNERTAIQNNLVNIVNRLTQKNYSDVVNHLDEVKSVIRNYRIRGSSETQSVLEERANRLIDECAVVEENLERTKSIREESEQASEQIQSAEEKIESLDGIIAELQEKTQHAANLQGESQQNHQSIEQILTSAKSHEENINSFIQRVEKREEQLDKQEQTTTSYQEQLASFEKEHKEKLEKAEALIKQARNALGYKTAEGISAAFNERYIEEKVRGKTALWWLAGATVFVGTGIGIGIWLVLGNSAIGLGATVSRITIMSFTLSGAWFCATQYVKHRNTLEDYGYKAVLSKSIVAFLDQLTGEERERYLEMVLLEIHKDPLRRRHDADYGPSQRVLNMAGRTIKRKAKRAVDKEADLPE